MSLRRIVSGGQTGADRGGLDAAIELEIPHGGWCPRGRRAEDGRIPSGYELEETESSRYEVRTERNVASSDATVVFTRGAPTGGSALTVAMARKHGKPCLPVDVERVSTDDAAARLRAFVLEQQVEILNVAGSRESGAPGLAEQVCRIIVASTSVG